MKLDYIKEKKELVSTVLLGISALLGVLILVKMTGFFVASAKAEVLVKRAVTQSKIDANDMEKYFSKSRAVADELKKKNLFVLPEQKKHPVNQVRGILGDEALIGDKWYKAGDKIGDAKIVAIEPTHAIIEWQGKEKIFAPMSAASATAPGGPRPVKAMANGIRRERPKMAVVRPIRGGREQPSEDRVMLENERAIEARQRALEVRTLRNDEVTYVIRKQ